MTPTEEARRDMLALINDDLILQSLLYDLNLLPEQLDESGPDWQRLVCIYAHWRQGVASGPSYRAALNGLIDANTNLAAIDPETKTTFYEASPTRNAECHARWVALNNALTYAKQLLN